MDKDTPYQKKQTKFSREELSLFTKEELIEKIIQVQAHNIQLRNVISKKNEEKDPDSNEDQNITQRKFDFSKCHTRRILLHILYFGWDYQGYVVQEDTTDTVEHHLFHALKKCCLVENRETAEYHRCGRTDKGVSAFGQVISLKIKSKYPPDIQGDANNIDNELQYCKMLNRLLPKEIKALRWMPLPEDKPDFSARFDCKKRQYKYYFPKSNLNLDAMKEAASFLIGSHDFRNLCKMDVGNGVTEFVRQIISVDILPVDQNDLDNPMSMYYLMIEGNAFLWHQIRCIMAVLLLIGSGKEKKDVMLSLLDHETNNRKPQYSMALDIPLNLFECSYDIKGRWVYDEGVLRNTISNLQKEWTLHNVKATMIKDCIKNLEMKYEDYKREKRTENSNINESEGDKIYAYADCLSMGVEPKKYIPLMERVTCSSLEEKIEHYEKKRKAGSKDNSKHAKKVHVE